MPGAIAVSIADGRAIEHRRGGREGDGSWTRHGWRQGDACGWAGHADLGTGVVITGAVSAGVEGQQTRPTAYRPC